VQVVLHDGVVFVGSLKIILNYKTNIQRTK